MHEMAIAQGILDIAVDTAVRHSAAKVLSIKLLVGQMTQVEPESLAFCFNALAAGSPADGAKLDVTIVPLTGRCNGCGHEFGIQQFCFVCPLCGSPGVEILSGRELMVEHLEVE